jgi:hypothetical protein
MTSLQKSGDTSVSPSVWVKAGVTDDKSGVANVQFAVWSVANHQSDLKWYNATDNGDGTYTLNVNVINDFKGYKGQYYFELYATDKAGNKACLAGTTINVTGETDSPKATLITSHEERAVCCMEPGERTG